MSFYNPWWKSPDRVRLKPKKKKPRKTKFKPAKGVSFLQNITENGLIFKDADNLNDKQLRQKIKELTESIQKEQCHQTLTDKISHLFNDKASSDITLEINDGVKFFVHRFILCSWSEVFLELFSKLDETTSTSTANEDDRQYEVSLPVDEVEAFQLFLKYMYTERLSADVDLIWEVISLADEYKVDELKKACSVALLEYISSSPVNGKLIKIMSKAQVHKLRNLKEAIWQRILRNLCFFPEILLPALSTRQLCEALKRSDLVAENEFCLFQILLPKMRELFTAAENVSLRKILHEVRFTEMSGDQLQRVLQLDIVQPIKSDIKDAILHRSLLWEKQSGIPHSKGPRLYLNPPAPILEKVNDKVKMHELSFLKNGESNWKCYSELIVTPEPPHNERNIPKISFEKSNATNIYFVNDFKSNSSWVCTGPNMKQVRLRDHGNQLLVTIETEYKKLTKLVQTEATVIVVVQDESKNFTEYVLSTKVPSKRDPQNHSLHFSKPICFNSHLKIPLEETKYLTLYVFIKV